MSRSYNKVGLIAGGGKLPHAVRSGAVQSGYDIFTLALTGFSKADDFDGDAAQFRIGDFGKIVKRLKSEKVDAICFAGIVTRPDFSALRPDMGGLKYLPGIIKAARGGDDALLAHVSDIFEKEGMIVIGPQEICASLLAPLGVIGAISPKDAYQEDIDKARSIAKAIGALDIGQGAVVSGGLVLAVEAQEGTQAMLERVAGLPVELRGDSAARAGVLAKMVKPGQESRLDLPTIGVDTINAAARAGLAGIAVEQGRAFILDRDQMIAAADKAGLFVIGLVPQDDGDHV